MASKSGLKMTQVAIKAFQKAKEYHLVFTSGYRSPAESVRVGGYSTDDHTKGIAADFAGSPGNMNAFANWAHNSGLFKRVIWQGHDLNSGMKIAGHYDHVHVSWSASGDGVTIGDMGGGLEKGDSNKFVKIIQALLGGLAVDGSFGPKTEKAVKEFQKERKLEDDGKVGPLTWKAMTGGKGVFFYR